jgi:hypothetical protein
MQTRRAGVAGDDREGGTVGDGAGDAGVGGVDEDAEFVGGFLEGLGADAGEPPERSPRMRVTVSPGEREPS